MSRGPLKTQGLELLYDLEASFPWGEDLKEPERSCKVLMIKPLSHLASCPPQEGDCSCRDFTLGSCTWSPAYLAYPKLIMTLRKETWFQESKYNDLQAMVDRRADMMKDTNNNLKYQESGTGREQVTFSERRQRLPKAHGQGITPNTSAYPAGRVTSPFAIQKENLLSSRPAHVHYSPNSIWGPELGSINPGWNWIVLG